MDIVRIQKNNGVHYDGAQIRRNVKGLMVAPVVRLDDLYEEYSRDGMGIEDCVKTLLDRLKDCEIPESMEQFVAGLSDWNLARDNVYPILLSTEDNQELLQKLVSMPMLDLSVAYIVRSNMKSGGTAKISREMLENYGISSEQLHIQAMENLRKDGYEFRDMTSLIQNMLMSEESEEMRERGERVMKMYVLANSCATYGAAGILDRELIKKFAGDQDYFILPSSIHETVFVPVDDKSDQEHLDKLVAGINEEVVREEERLSSHSYYYDAGTGEIRVHA